MAFDFITSSFTSFFLVFSSEDGDNSTCSERAHLILVGYFAALLFLLLANFLERALLKHLTMHRLITLMYKNDIYMVNTITCTFYQYGVKEGNGVILQFSYFYLKGNCNLWQMMIS